MDVSKYVDFERILELFERHGRKLQRIWKTYRVFIDPTGEEPLPFLIPVEGQKVHERYFQKIKQFFEEAEEKP